VSNKKYQELVNTFTINSDEEKTSPKALYEMIFQGSGEIYPRNEKKN
jgi:hypothetical protein